MSAFEVGKVHIDALLTAGVVWGMPHRHEGPIRWTVNIEDHPDYARAFEPGEPWGPAASKVYRDSMRELTRDRAGQVGAMLMAENRRSVDFRYDETEIEEPYIYRELQGTPDPVVVLKAISCFEYQACETPDWPKSEAFAFCRALEQRAISNLPGYRDANAWEITDPSVFLNAAAAKMARRAS
jgi:hypothetical protein